MKRKSRIEVIFFNIILNMILLSTNITFAKSMNGYVEKPIEFFIDVEESIKIEAEKVELNFGMISKYSTGKVVAETQIEAKGPSIGSKMTAKFVENYQSAMEIPLEKDGYTKIILREEQNSESKKIDFSKEKFETDEINYLEVFLERINDKEYEFKENLSETKAIVPIKGEIRSVNNVKKGTYLGEVSVYLELITPNNEVRK